MFNWKSPSTLHIAQIPDLCGAESWHRVYSGEREVPIQVRHSATAQFISRRTGPSRSFKIIRLRLDPWLRHVSLGPHRIWRCAATPTALAKMGWSADYLEGGVPPRGSS